jgi:hypothetical protein
VFGLLTFGMSRVLTDGIWHRVQWRRDRSDLIAAVDGNTQRLDTQFDPYGADTNTTVGVFLGAKPFHTGTVL